MDVDLQRHVERRRLVHARPQRGKQAQSVVVRKRADPEPTLRTRHELLVDCAGVPAGEARHLWSAPCQNNVACVMLQQAAGGAQPLCCPAAGDAVIGQIGQFAGELCQVAPAR